MLKKLFVLAAVFTLISCQNLLKKSDSKDVTNPTEAAVESGEETKAPYQTVEGEEQAKEINAQTQEAIEEVEVQDRVFFKYDSSDLSDDAKKILDTQVAWLKSDPTIKIVIEGHCDERGTREYNIALGERRANAAKSYLVSEGVTESRLTVISYGKERPAFVGATEEIFAKNRRSVTALNQE